MPTIKYEKASLGHIPAMENFERHYFYNEAFSRRQLLYLLRSPNSIAISATADGSLVGYVIGTLRKRYKVCNICTFCIQEDFRRKNIASELLSELEKECVHKDINRLTLEVREDNIPALKFYRKSGFVEFKKLPKYYKNGFTAIRMEKFLEKRTQPQ